ncbi:MAG: hypothetical protein QXS01_01165 [Candidatus Bathyarchaeia archaeon]
MLEFRCDRLVCRNGQIFAVIGALLSITGFISNNVDLGFFGIALTFACFSGALTCCVRSDNPAKRILEVVLMFGSFGTIFYGYFLTGSLLLLGFTALIVVMLFVGFVLSYLAPKLLRKTGKA